jgi:hypothetical protein
MNGKAPLAYPHPLDRLSQLPIEIQFDILCYLHPEFSTGLRGTSKKFRDMYDYRNGTIPFTPITSIAEWLDKYYVPDQLWHLLHNWMRPEWFWSSWNSKFITEKEFRKEERERARILYPPWWWMWRGCGGK